MAVGGEGMSTVAVRTLRNFVDGEYRDAASDAFTSLINPSTGEEFARSPISSPADAWRRRCPTTRTNPRTF